jgi:hypothetical protein
VPVVGHDLLVEFLLVDTLVLMDDVVEDLGRHVLGGGHGELRDIAELEGRAVINELHVADGAILPLALHLQQNVLSLQVGVHHLALAQKRQRSADVKNQRRQQSGLHGHSLIERFVVDLNILTEYLVKFLFAVDLFRSNVVEGATEREATLLVEDPSVCLVYFVGIEPNQVLDSWKARKLRLGNSSEREEHGAEPNLLDVGLVSVLGDDLLNGELPPRLYVLAEPHQTESSSTQQLHLLETVRKTVSKSVFLLLCQSE